MQRVVRILQRRLGLDRLRAEGGMTVVELVIAVFIITVSLFSVASLAIVTTVSVDDSRLRQEATAAATSSLEAARQVGSIDELDVEVPPHALDPEDSGGISLETEVSPVLDEEGNEVSGAWRVTATASWQRAGNSPDEVVQSTIVTEASLREADDA